ncbi:MAG: T9SS type A sorting domain-containing protein [Bacteroidota bacterium]
MKKNLLTLSLAIAFVSIKSQVIIDTVSVGPAYANQVWYSLANDNQGSASKSNWDLAFDCSGQGSTIHINSVTGTTLWQYPGADTTGWNTLDTAGINSWSKRWNSDTSWAMGAMGRYASLSNPNDLDWGVYSSITHVVTGDSLYVIKLANGAYKKLHIRTLSGGTYNFRYADLGGANLQNATLTKSVYAGQNFGYYSIQNNAVLSREPLSANWDLLFTQYTAYIPTPYTVTGVLQNKGVKVAKVKPVANANSYVSWSAHTFKTAINVIGYDWKAFGTGWTIEDSLVYFVQSKPGAIWKVIPTGFGGSANGNNIFSKEMLSAVGIKEANGNNIATMVVYPNPSDGNNVSLILSTEEVIQDPLLRLYDGNGRMVRETHLNSTKNDQLNVFQIDTHDLENGIYMLSLSINGKTANQKLIITK